MATTPTNGESAVSVRSMVLDHDSRIDDLERWRAELRGAFRLVMFALGTSIVSAFASIATIVALISGGRA